MINHLVGGDELLAFTDNMARVIAGNSPLSSA